MELRHYLSIAWKWAWLIALAVVIAGASSLLASRAATPLYRAKTTLMVGRGIENPEPTSYDFYSSQQLAATYVQLTTREPVMQGVIDRLGLEMGWQELAGRVSASTVPQTQLLEIMVIDSDPYRASVLANEVAEQLILISPSGVSGSNPEQVEFTQTQLADLREKITEAQEEIKQLRLELDAANSARTIQDLENQIALLESKVSGWQNTYSQLLITVEGGEVNAISVIEKAMIPTAPFSPNVRMNMLTAAAIGLALAVGGVFLIEYLDDTIKSAEDVKRLTNAPVLGSIPRIEGEEYPEKLVAMTDPLSPVVEAFRLLRTNLQLQSADKPLRKILITSAGPSEGKSVVLANLAVVTAQSGKQVTLVDTDMRRPVQHHIFSVDNASGLNNYFKNSNSAEAIETQETGVKNLGLLTCGEVAENPAELLGSEAMKTLVEALDDKADLLLFDSPPSLVVADAAIMSSYVDGVILVVDARSTRTGELKRCVEELKRVSAPMLGVVLNRMSERHGGYYYYYYADGKKKKHKPSWRRTLDRALARFKKKP